MVASLQDTSLEEECFTQALLESHIPVAHTHSHSTSHNLPHYASALPLSHESAMKWFYKDPQGEIQGNSGYHVNLGGFLCVNYSIKCGLYWLSLSGPFTKVEMCEWLQAGYFTTNLLVKRGCDEGFQPLGEVIKMWGRVPFSPGPSPPPLLVRKCVLCFVPCINN